MSILLEEILREIKTHIKNRGLEWQALRHLHVGFIVSPTVTVTSCVPMISISHS